MMEPVKALEPYSSWGGITVNDEIILHLNNRSSGFAPSYREEGLVVVSSVDNLSDTLATLMPRIIPAGYQPQVYNGVQVVQKTGYEIYVYNPGYLYRFEMPN